MNVIAPRTLRAFWKKHPQSEARLKEWLKDMQSSRYENLNQLRQVYPSADYIKGKGDEEITVFNIGGNDFRLITFVRYTAQTVFIRRVFTHAEYNTWNQQGRPL